MCTDEKDITPEDDSIYIAKNAYQNFSDVLFEQQSK
jgi:hypothetical protein